MYITVDEMQILHESLRRFQLKSDILAVRFHANLYREAKNAVGLFSADLEHHPEKALQALYAVVILLQGNAESERMITILKQRQAASLVEPEAFMLIAQALEHSLQQVFGDSFPVSYIQAWRTAFCVIGIILYEKDIFLLPDQRLGPNETIMI